MRLNKLLGDRKIELVLMDAAKSFLAKRGYEPAYGARPLKRVIQKHLVDALSMKILGGEIRDGSNVRVDCDRDQLVFS